MPALSVNLSDELRSFIDRQVHEGGYQDCGEYIRDLIRKERDRQHFEALILEGAASPRAVVADDQYFDQLLRRLDEAERE